MTWPARRESTALSFSDEGRSPLRIVPMRSDLERAAEFPNFGRKVAMTDWALCAHPFGPLLRGRFAIQISGAGEVLPGRLDE
ncbi:MAG: hypothetical protein CL820_01290 [Croceicoccus sp.]|nr:hypothetical protein [Croceicoccus sp.]